MSLLSDRRRIIELIEGLNYNILLVPKETKFEIDGIQFGIQLNGDGHWFAYMYGAEVGISNLKYVEGLQKWLWGVPTERRYCYRCGGHKDTHQVILGQASNIDTFCRDCIMTLYKIGLLFVIICTYSIRAFLDFNPKG